jgi:hypothetical protein
VALDPRGQTLGFPPLSQRIHLTKPRDISAASHRQPAGFIAFDVLRIGDEDLRWTELERDLDPRDFTILTIAARVRSVDDLWWSLRTARGVDARAIAEGARLRKSA